MIPPLSYEETKIQLAALANLSGRDESDLLECSVEELQLLLKVYRDAAAPKERTGFDSFLAVLGLCAQVAGPFATVAGAFAGVFAASAAGAKL